MGNTPVQQPTTPEGPNDVIIICDVPTMAQQFITKNESVVIWHDPNINSQENTIYLERLRDTNEVRTFERYEEAIKYINKLSSHAHVITSGQNGEKFANVIEKKPNVASLFLFCKNTAFHKWTKNYPKIEAPLNNFEELFGKLNNQILKWQQENPSLKLDFPAFAPVFDDIDTAKNNKTHSYLKGFIHFKNRKQAKQDFLALSKAVYPRDKKNMNDFETKYNEYNMEQAFVWYTKECFLYKLVNNCLRIANSDSILYVRLILADLERAIKEHYAKESYKFSGLLYRGAYISQIEWGNLERNIGKEIEMHGFLSTSKKKGKAREFAAMDSKNKIMITIIVPSNFKKEMSSFNKKANNSSTGTVPINGEPNAVNQEDQGFAEIRDFSEFKAEEEILFNVRSRFTILEVRKEKSVEECDDTNQINSSTMRHLVLLYGADLMRQYIYLKKPVVKISFEDVKQLFCHLCRNKISDHSPLIYANLKEKDEYLCEKCFEDVKQLFCHLCRNKISDHNPLIYANLKEKDEYLCEKCVSSNKRTKPPYLCVPLQSIKNGHSIEVEGMTVRYKTRAIPFYSSKCIGHKDVTQSVQHLLFQCADCPTQDKIWCESCFNLDNTCKQEHHTIKVRNQSENKCLNNHRNLPAEDQPLQFLQFRCLECSEIDKFWCERCFGMKNKCLMKGHKVVVEDNPNNDCIDDQHKITIEDISLHHSQFRCLDCVEAKKIWCKGCFNVKNECMEKGHRVIIEHQSINRCVNNTMSDVSFGIPPGQCIQFKCLECLDETMRWCTKCINADHKCIKDKHKIVIDDVTAVQCGSMQHKVNLKDLPVRHLQYKCVKCANPKQVWCEKLFDINNDCRTNGHEIMIECRSHNENIKADKHQNKNNIQILDPNNNESMKSEDTSNNQPTRHIQFRCRTCPRAKKVWYKGCLSENNECIRNNHDVVVEPQLLQFRCLECPKKVWCEGCFNSDNECIKDGHNVIVEDQPFTFWSQSLSGDEVSHFKTHVKTSKKSELFAQAEAYYQAEDYEKAKQFYENFLAQEGNKNAEEEERSYNNLGLACDKLGDNEKAIEYHKKSIEAARKIDGHKHLLAASYQNLASAYCNVERYKNAIECYNISLEIKISIFKEDHPEIAEVYSGLGGLYYKQRDFRIAKDYHMRALEIRKNKCGMEHLSTAFSYNDLGSVEKDLGNNQTAMDYFHESLKIKKAANGLHHSSTAITYNNLAVLYEEMERYEVALEFFNKALEINLIVYGDQHLETAESHWTLAAAYEDSEENEEAIKHYLKSLDIYQAKSRKTEMMDLYTKLRSIYLKLGDHEKVANYQVLMNTI